MLLQAIPVLHFFSSQKEIFYALIDEEKPGEKVSPEKKAAKEFLSCFDLLPAVTESTRCYVPFLGSAYASPLLDDPTRPPNA